MAEKPDYYTILGILRDASPEEIKQAYLDAAQRLHPDKNRAVGETEMFLDVQQAYEVLSNPKRRAKYDATLKPVEKQASPVAHRLLFSRRSLVRTQGTQLLYVVLEIKPRLAAGKAPAPPLNVCLVLDRSKSMKGQKMDMVKAAAVRMLRGLQDQDVFGVVGFSDRAEVIIPSSYVTDRNRMESRIQMMDNDGATEIYQGLQAGVDQVRGHLDPGRVNHVILLTDGHTYGDEPACLTLAGESAGRGIRISTLGIGQGWNDLFLDELASKTGGTSLYVSTPQDIQRLLVAKFDSLTRIFADDVIIDYTSVPNVELVYAFRLQPESGPLELTSPVHAGPIYQDMSFSVLLEFKVLSDALSANPVPILKGQARVNATNQPVPVPPIRMDLDRPVSEEAGEDIPPQAIVKALSRLTLYRLQERARLATAAGDLDMATRLLQNLASHLLGQGENDLANTTLLEIEHIQRTKSSSSEGQKKIKYGTRALVGIEKELEG